MRSYIASIRIKKKTTIFPVEQALPSYRSSVCTVMQMNPAHQGGRRPKLTHRENFMFSFFLSCLKVKIVFHRQPLQKLTSSCPCFRQKQKQKQPKINPNLPLRAEQNQFISATREWGERYCPLPAAICLSILLMISELFLGQKSRVL